MRKVFIIIFVILFLAQQQPCLAAEPVLAAGEFSAALDLPAQESAPCLADLLFELRAERGGYTLFVATHFPQGLGKDVDKLVADLAKSLHGSSYVGLQELVEFGVGQYLEGLTDSFMRQAETDADKAFTLPERPPRDWSNTFTSVTTWEFFQPSSRYASVLFREDSAGGGAHGNWTYKAASYDLLKNKELSLEDLFPGVDGLLPLLDAHVLAALGSKINEPLEERDMNIAMERILLTPKGIRVVYAPYEIGSYADGEFMVDLPKEELIRLGALPELWQNEGQAPIPGVCAAARSAKSTTRQSE